MPAQKQHRALAIAQAGALDGGELVEPCRKPNDTAKRGTGAHHRRSDEPDAFKPPLGHNRNEAETRPYQEIIAGEKYPGFHEGRKRCRLLPPDCREQQDHGSAALGTIMAIIITHHMVNISAA